MKHFNILILILIFLFPLYLLSQPDTLTDSKKKEEVLKLYNRTHPDTIKKAPAKKFEMQKSPMGAVLRSMIIPGWGQFYVERYWKVPLVTGAFGFLTYMVIDYNKKYLEKSKQVDILKKADPNDVNIFMEKQYREFYRDNRDMSAFYMLAVYVVAAVDCYADAHLFDFNIEDKFALVFSPNFFGGVSVTFSYKIR